MIQALFQINVTAVDNSPVMKEMALKLFGFEQNDKNHIVIADAAEFLRNEAENGIHPSDIRVYTVIIKKENTTQSSLMFATTTRTVPISALLICSLTKNL